MWLVSQRGYIGLEVERKGFLNTSVCFFNCIICFDGLRVMYSHFSSPTQKTCYGNRADEQPIASIFWLVESWIQFKKSGIPLNIGIQNQVLLTRNAGSSTWNPESMARIPESNNLEFPYAGRTPGANIAWLNEFVRRLHCLPEPPLLVRLSQEN